MSGIMGQIGEFMNNKKICPFMGGGMPGVGGGVPGAAASPMGMMGGAMGGGNQYCVEDKCALWIKTPSENSPFSAQQSITSGEEQDFFTMLTATTDPFLTQPDKKIKGRCGLKTADFLELIYKIQHHRHNAHEHPRGHRSPKETVKGNSPFFDFPQKISRVNQLINEVTSSEDMDGDGVIYGHDWMVNPADPKKPPILQNMDNSLGKLPYFKIDWSDALKFKFPPMVNNVSPSVLISGSDTYVRIIGGFFTSSFHRKIKVWINKKRLPDSCVKIKNMRTLYIKIPGSYVSSVGKYRMSIQNFGNTFELKGLSGVMATVFGTGAKKTFNDRFEAVSTLDAVDFQRYTLLQTILMGEMMSIDEPKPKNPDDVIKEYTNNEEQFEMETPVPLLDDTPGLVKVFDNCNTSNVYMVGPKDDYIELTPAKSQKIGRLSVVMAYPEETDPPATVDVNVYEKVDADIDFTFEQPDWWKNGVVYDETDDDDENSDKSAKIREYSIIKLRNISSTKYTIMDYEWEIKNSITGETFYGNFNSKSENPAITFSDDSQILNDDVNADLDEVFETKFDDETFKSNDGDQNDDVVEINEDAIELDSVEGVFDVTLRVRVREKAKPIEITKKAYINTYRKRRTGRPRRLANLVRVAKDYTEAYDVEQSKITKEKSLKFPDFYSPRVIAETGQEIKFYNNYKLDNQYRLFGKHKCVFVEYNESIYDDINLNVPEGKSFLNVFDMTTYPEKPGSPTSDTVYYDSAATLEGHETGCLYLKCDTFYYQIFKKTDAHIHFMPRFAADVWDFGDTKKRIRNKNIRTRMSSNGILFKRSLRYRIDHEYETPGSYDVKRTLIFRRLFVFYNDYITIIKKTNLGDIGGKISVKNFNNDFILYGGIKPHIPVRFNKYAAAYDYVKTEKNGYITVYDESNTSKISEYKYTGKSDIYVGTISCEKTGDEPLNDITNTSLYEYKYLDTYGQDFHTTGSFLHWKGFDSNCDELLQPVTYTFRPQLEDNFTEIADEYIPPFLSNLLVNNTSLSTNWAYNIFSYGMGFMKLERIKDFEDEFFENGVPAISDQTTIGEDCIDFIGYLDADLPPDTPLSENAYIDTNLIVVGDAALTVYFIGETCLNNVRLMWDFGDGNSACDTLTPVHTYSTPGIYTVTLTVQKENVLEDGTITYTDASVKRKRNYIVVNNPDIDETEPEIDPSEGVFDFYSIDSRIGNSYEDCGYSVRFISSPVDINWTYEWDFGDGVTESGKGLYYTKHVYVPDVDSYEIYTVSLKIYSDDYVINKTITRNNYIMVRN